MIKGNIIHVYEIWLIRVLVIFIIFLLTVELISCYYSTTEGGGLTVKSVVSSGLGPGSLRFESCNEKCLRLNPTIPELASALVGLG